MEVGIKNISYRSRFLQLIPTYPIAKSCLFKCSDFSHTLLTPWGNQNFRLLNQYYTVFLKFLKDHKVL